MTPRRSTSETGWIIAFGVVVGIILSALLYGWPVMILVGILWHEFGILRPIGYPISCAIGILLAVVFGRPGK